MLDKNLYHVGDPITVQFSDEDIPVRGIVERDSSERLYILFSDNSVAYNDFRVLD